jgi:hypothetical protein
MTSQDSLDAVGTPTELLGRVRAVHSTVRAAEAELLVLACAWADWHPAEVSPEPHPARHTPGRFDDLDPALEDEAVLESGPDERRGIPAYSWDCAASFAAAIGRSTRAGSNARETRDSCDSLPSAATTA